MDISGGDVDSWATWERRGGLRQDTFHHRLRRDSDSSESSSSSGATSDPTPLARFNRLLVRSVARHWAFFRGSRLIPAVPADARPRSISDVGISDIASSGGGGGGNDGSEYALPAGGRGCRSSSHADVPALRITAAAIETEHSDFSDAERHGPRLLVPRSTGNFVGSGGGGGGAGGGGATAAPRSAPATPLQLEPHQRHLTIAAAASAARTDKNAVKQLSSSAPSVRAAGGGGGGGGSGEGDSGESKAPSKTPSKARQKKFLRHFPQVGPDERVLNYYSCALVGDILLQGHLYITKNYFAFYSNVFGYVTKLLIPTALVLRVSKEKMARIIPNAVGVCTRDERHVFGSLLSRDSTYKLMLTVWRAAAPSEQATPQPQEELRVSEVELDASEYSPEDESSSGGGDSTLHPRCTRRASPSAAAAPLPHQGDIVSAKSPAMIQPTLLLGGAGVGGANAEGRSRGGGRGGGGLLSALLVLLALALAASAAALAYTIYRQRQAATLPTQSDLMRLRSADMYGELLAWQARLHSQAAGEVHAFLNTNMHLLAKVRQSLEALSTMMLADAGKQSAEALRFDSGAAPSSDNRPQPGVS